MTYFFVCCRSSEPGKNPIQGRNWGIVLGHRAARDWCSRIVLKGRGKYNGPPSAICRILCATMRKAVKPILSLPERQSLLFSDCSSQRTPQALGAKRNTSQSAHAAPSKGESKGNVVICGIVFRHIRGKYAGSHRNSAAHEHSAAKPA